MKNIVFLLCTLLFAVACNSTTSKSDDSNSENPSNDFLLFELKQNTQVYFLEEKLGASLSNVKVVGIGFKNTKDTIYFNGIDPIDTAFVHDLNQDGDMELYFVSRSVGSGSYAQLYGISFFGNKSYAPIHVRSMAQNSLDSTTGKYMGHDLYAIKSNKLIRSFPLYKEDDSNVSPTGGNATFRYNLIKGETSFQLVPEPISIPN